MSEFNLIEQFFQSLAESYPSMQRQDVALGIGDDCALLQMPVDKQLAVSMDTLVAGIHFPEQTSAYDIGYKSLAVNLSDLAAMGAEPAWVSLALTLPEENTDWLQAFTRGFAELAAQYHLQLIGGDTTRGPLSITLQIYGWVSAEQALCRHQAVSGDDIYVSGSLGDAGLGLLKALGQTQDKGLEFCLQRLNRPSPRVELGQSLLGLSRCAIDISDGLLADLGHITKQSQLGAVIRLDDLPLSDELRAFYKDKINWSQIVNGGDDYELCFTASVSHRAAISQLQQSLNIPLSRIGKMVAGRQICCVDGQQQPVAIAPAGYNHFQEGR